MSPITTTVNASQFGNAIAPQSDRVTLPFSHLWMYWANGNPAAPKDSGAQYFGGWAADADEFAASMGALGKSAMPANFSAVQTWVNREGGEYNVISARAIYAAPIATRLTWSKTDSGGNMSHLAMLCYLATLTKEGGEIKMQPYAPIVLTAKSYSGQNVQNAFKKWISDTAAARAQYAPGVPANLFYMGVGTFGETRKQVMVGKGNSQSPIVPAHLKETEWTEKNLELCFVGDEIARQMLELKAQAAEWLEDKKEAKPAQVAPNASLDEINAALNGADEFGF
jgi:hypothetical protein